ncbi:MAG: VOC family protein [Mariniblastus sp.]
MKLQFILLATVSVIAGAMVMAQEKKETEFSKPTIDFGCVVSDIDASVKFYTEAVGFEVTGGFSVTSELASDAGLTDKSLDIKVLTLGEGPGATQLKLMQVEGESVKANHDYINSTLGLSYMTVFVKSTDVAIERLTKFGVKPISKGPVVLPGGTMALTVVRDPDGNFVELVGPKSEK